MDPERWKKVQELFHAALEQRADARRAFLDRACADDEALRAEVESLIAAGERADSRIEGAVGGVLELAAARADSAPRSQIGPYKVLGELGRGGLSTVYLAERADEHYRMKVAVKLIRRGLDTEDILDRLRQERQILANLDHPNIAKLLDGGTTEDGVPYVVMEYIQGDLIDRYCDRQKLSTTQRLELFRQACSAVHYAHQNLVIHRDIKPGNLLVTADGTPKLLDFGIAKLLDPGLVAHPVAPTATDVRLLTPEYASPEQVRGQPLTTATDVYSLGVLLYNLLTGHPPYRLKSRRPQEIERVICETDAEKPSSAVNRVEVVPGPDGEVTLTPEAVSLPREGQPEKLRRRLAGDLDNIVLMAIAKEPHRRYASAEQLSEDLRRYLGALPVVARPPTLRYRCAKFVRRNRAGVAAAALVLAALVAGIVATAWQARIAVAERNRAELNLDRAEIQQARAEQVSDFLVDLFKVSDPEQALGNEITAREVLERGAEKIEWELRESPELRATMMSTIGRVYQNLGLYEQAAPLLEEALAVRRQALGEDHQDVARSLVDLALLRHGRGADADAESLLQEALAKQLDLYGEEHREVATTLRSLAVIKQAQGDFQAAEELFRRVLDLRRRVLAEDDPEIAESLNDLGEPLFIMGDLEAAEDYFRQALDLRLAVLDEAHPDVTTSRNNLAVVLFEKGDYPAAEELLREVLAVRRKVQGDEHPNVAIALNNLAAVLEAQNELEAVEPLYRQALAIDRKLKGEVHRDVAVGLANLGVVLERKGDLEEAERHFRDALAIRRELAGNESPLVALTLNRLAGVLAARGRSAEAESHFREALGILRQAVPEGDRDLALPLVGLGQLLTHQGRPAEAEPLLREAIRIRRAHLGEGHWEIAEAESVLGACLTALGSYEEAEPLVRDAYPIIKKSLGDQDRRTSQARDRVAALYQAWGKPEAAGRYRAEISPE